MKRCTIQSLAIACFISLVTYGISAFASEGVYSIKVKSSFDDARFEIENAIVNQGFVVDFNGDVAEMLARTSNVANDVQPIYKNAEFWQFCSSKITREMITLDAENLAHCPFVIFAYETASNPDQIIVGYKLLKVDTGNSSSAIIDRINAMLKAIIAEVE